MAMTVTLGWWFLPVTITFAAFSVAAYMCRDEGSHGDYAAIGNAMVALVVYGAALIVSLMAWLVWAVVF
jgi:hypothetical protein